MCIALDIQYQSVHFHTAQRSVNTHVAQLPKREGAFAIKLELSSLMMHMLLLRQSASNRISCFHDSLSKTKHMKASSERALVTALLRALSHCFHEELWAESTFMRCMWKRTE